MSYFVPYADDSGFHVPTYADIRDQLIEEAQAIFGQDTYLDTDSADYQFISVVALKMFDSNQSSLLAYNNRSPLTAIGAGLDGLVLLNGIARTPATYSTCVVTLTGTAGTVIEGGEVRDTSDYIWTLPTTVTIPSAGTIEVTATCTEIGAIEAEIGTISKIETPTSGWISVTNTVQAIAGKAYETDAALRARQVLSVAAPSQTLLQGTKAAILAISGVTRCEVYENDTSTTTIEGFPPHSITSVVEGGADLDVAEAILYHKGIGGGTNGTTTQTVYDSDNQPYDIKFYRPTYTNIYVSVSLVKLSGYQTSLGVQIQTALVDYLNSLALGSDITISALWGIVMNQMPDLKTPIFSVSSLTAGVTSGSLGTSNITLSFNVASQASASTVTVTAI